MKNIMHFITSSLENNSMSCNWSAKLMTANNMIVSKWQWPILCGSRNISSTCLKAQWLMGHNVTEIYKNSMIEQKFGSYRDQPHFNKLQEQQQITLDSWTKRVPAWKFSYNGSVYESRCNCYVSKVQCESSCSGDIKIRKCSPQWKENSEHVWQILRVCWLMLSVRCPPLHHLPPLAISLSPSTLLVMESYNI